MDAALGKSARGVFVGGFACFELLELVSARLEVECSPARSLVSGIFWDDLVSAFEGLSLAFEVLLRAVCTVPCRKCGGTAAASHITSPLEERAAGYCFTSILNSLLSFLAPTVLLRQVTKV